MSYKTPLKCFETGFYKREDFFYILWKFVGVSAHEPTSVSSILTESQS